MDMAVTDLILPHCLALVQEHRLCFPVPLSSGSPPLLYRGTEPKTPNEQSYGWSF